MDKEELIIETAARAGVSKTIASGCIDAILDTITCALADGERVKLANFGVFEPKHKAATVGRNLSNNTTVRIPARVVPAFTPGKGFKEIVSASHRTKEADTKTNIK